MATLTIQTPASDGAALSTVAANAGGDAYPNSGSEMLVVVNGGSSITVTFTAQRACDLGSTHDSGPHTVAGGATEYFPGLDPNIFNDDNNRVQVAYSAVTSVTVGVLRPS